MDRIHSGIIYVFKQKCPNEGPNYRLPSERHNINHQRHNPIPLSKQRNENSKYVGIWGGFRDLSGELYEYAMTYMRETISFARVVAGNCGATCGLAH